MSQTRERVLLGGTLKKPTKGRMQGERGGYAEKTDCEGAWADEGGKRRGGGSSGGRRGWIAKKGTNMS